MGLFSVYHVNIQSLLPKLDIIEQEIQPYDVAIFTETWLNDKIQDDSLTIPNFSPPHRLDRHGRIGERVANLCSGFINFQKKNRFGDRKPRSSLD